MHKRKIISILIFCFLIPITAIAAYLLLKNSQYYIVSLIIVIGSMLPFFFSLERKKPQVRELVIMASVIAISVSSRAAFFYLPQVKPMCALLIIAAVSFGAEFGFITGALSMLLSNFIFGQGAWTVFQMLGMGLTAFLSAIIIRLIKTNNGIISGLISGVLCFAVYGFFANLSFVLMAGADLRSSLSVFVSGMPFDLVHGITTFLIVALLKNELGEKLERLKIKYGLFVQNDKKI